MIKVFTCLFALLFSAERIAAQCMPQLLNCHDDTQTYCDTSLNSSQYWNDLLWWDNANQSHDLAETTVDLNFSIRDTCHNGSLAIRCFISLDLDNDGDFETLVDTDNPPAPGKVNFGNITGIGTPRQFDQRPLPNNQRWRFVLEKEQVGDTLTARLRWNSALAPNDFVLPELPYGLHKVRWEVRDGTSVLDTCAYLFQVKDCKAPVIQCLSGLSADILPTHQAQVWAADFLLFTEDNTTPTSLIKIGIRKAGTGTGFPVDNLGNPLTSVIYDCTTEFGPQEIELWAMDIVGNADFCASTVSITDPNGYCTNSGGVVKACTSVACYGNVFEDYDIEYELSYVDSGQTFTQFSTKNCGVIGQNTPINKDITITPNGDGAYNSYISTYDAVIISRHVTHTDTLDTPYQWVAADANRDGMITSEDVKACRDHVLGIKLLDHAWHFVEKNYVFPWPGNPLAVPFPESVTVHPDNSTPVEVEFYAIPICDVTCGNVVGFFELESENQHLIGTPQPNPTSAGAMLPLQLRSEETVRFEMTDAAGKLLFSQTLSLPQGDEMFDIPDQAMPMSGLYFWRIRAGNVVKSGKISKIGAQ